MFWCHLQALLTLRNTAHAVQLLGVVVDDEGKLLKGMLVELPGKGPMFQLMAKSRSAEAPVPWPRRQKQKWAKKIVKGIAAFHERGQVLTVLRTDSFCIRIVI